MTKKIKISLISIICAVAVAVGAYGVYSRLHPKEVTSNDFEFEDEQVPTGAEDSEDAGITIPGYKEIDIPAGQEDVEVTITNPEENNVYFEVSFVLSDTGEEIYKSKLIKPGQSLYNITLDKVMEAGEYNLTVKYATYGMDEEYTPKNGAEVNCMLVVQ